MYALNADLLHVLCGMLYGREMEKVLNEKDGGKERKERGGRAARFTFALVGKKVMEGGRRGRCFVADSCWREWVGPDPKKRGNRCHTWALQLQEKMARLLCRKVENRKLFD